jgi:hypothetical protein
MSLTRMETEWPDLTRLLRAATPARQLAASLAGCELALARTGLDEPLLTAACRRLRQGQRTLSPDERSQLEALANRLDQEYFDLHDAAEVGQASEAQWTAKFYQARATAAVLNAFDANPFEAARESIYEAIHSGEDEATVVGVVEGMLTV